MIEYLITDAYPAPLGGWYVKDANGRGKNVTNGSVTTLRDDFVLSMAAVIEPLGGEGQVPLVVLAAGGLDIDDDDNWTAADPGGHYATNDEKTDLLFYFDGTGGGEREPVILGSPSIDLAAEPIEIGQERRYGPFSRARFGPLLRIDLPEGHEEGLWLMAVRKEPL